MPHSVNAVYKINMAGKNTESRGSLFFSLTTLTFHQTIVKSFKL